MTVTDSATIRKIADEAFTALNRGAGQVLPFSTRYPAFSMDDAYRVIALVTGDPKARSGMIKASGSGRVSATF